MPLDPKTRNIVVMGASAGGVEALSTLLGALPPSLDAAVLVVLHIPPHAPSQLDRILSRATRMRVVVAKEGEALQPQTVYVASADRHLMVDAQGIRITRGPKESRARPAVDVLFRSAASAYGARVIGVVLSGTLDDGTAGLWAIKDKGGVTMVQDPSEAAYDSMPSSAIAHVEIDFAGSLEALAQQISSLVGTRTGNAIESRVNHRHEVENAIALEGNGIKAGVMELGAISKYTCPDCHGVLVQIEEGSIVRFRCHTGHAFSLQTLVAEVNAAIDTGLWDTLRAVEERVMLLRQMAELATASGAEADAAKCSQQADDAEIRLKPLRELVLDPAFFGHDPER